MSGRISRFHEARVAVFQALSVSLRKPIRDPSWNIARAKLLRLHEAVVALRQPLVDLDRLPPEILLDRGYSSHDIAEVDNEERSISRLNLSVSAQFDDIVRQFVAVEAEMMKTGDLMPDKYRGRDGAAEAKANFLAGGGPILYYSDYNGRAPGITVHGLNCWTSYDPFGSIKFVMLPEASFYERGFFDIVADVRSASASRFAQAYNRFVFKTREADVLRACPKASVIMSAGDREADAAK